LTYKNNSTGKENSYLSPEDSCLINNEVSEQDAKASPLSDAKTLQDPFAELPEENKRLPEQVSDLFDAVVEGTTIGLFNPHLGARVRKIEVPKNRPGYVWPRTDAVATADKKGNIIKRFFTRRESWFAFLGLFMTIVFIAIALIYPPFFDQLRAWGYIGLFIISLIGSSAAIIPVPGLAVQFTLGATMPPPFGWQLWAGPIVVGVVGAVAETIGSFTIYMTGVGGGASLNENAKKSVGRWARVYNWIMRLMKRYSFLAVFLVSVVPNPFFYPVALAAGAANIGKRKFIFFVLLGKIIKCCFIAYLGYWLLGGVTGI